jgi:hypothetical protein
VSKNGSPESNRAVVADGHRLRVIFIDVHILANPDIFSDSGTPHPVDPGTDAVAAGRKIRKFMQDTVDYLRKHKIPPLPTGKGSAKNRIPFRKLFHAGCLMIILKGNSADLIENMQITCQASGSNLTKKARNR